MQSNCQINIVRDDVSAGKLTQDALKYAFVVDNAGEDP